MRMKKMNILFVILTFILVAGASVVFATSTEDTKTLGLFEQISDDVNLNQYANHINEISDDSAKIATEDFNLFIHNTIFTDHHVYAIIGLEDSETQELNMFGHIIYAEVDQAIFGLVGEVQELEQEDGVRYFYYTGKIAQTGKPSEDKQVVRAASHQFLKFTSLRDFEETMLEFTLNLDGNEYLLTTKVNNVFTKALVFDTDADLYAGDFYDTVTLTPYELKLEGKSESLLVADEAEWEQPHFYVTIIRKGKPDLHMKYDTRGSISDEGFPLGMSRGHSSDTGEFYHYWSFHEWELDLKEVTALIIDGETYRVKK